MRTPSFAGGIPFVPGQGRGFVRLWAVLIALLCPASVVGQQFAYVDTDYILKKVPEYKQAQQKLDQYAQQWKEEIERRQKEIDKLVQDLQAEKVLLPDKVVEKRQKEIESKKQALEQYKNEKFGRQGALYQKRKELIKPVQDRVFEAVQRLADQNALDIVFDKAGAVTMLYTNAKYDRSDEVLELMGISLRKQDAE
jgi:outer membrane protein